MTLPTEADNPSPVARLARVLIRPAMTAAYHGLLLFDRLTGSRTPGVSAMVVTADGRIVLVRHSYRPGWHFPGGGRKRGEAPEQAILRELREEIGLVAWAGIEPIASASGAPHAFIVTGAEYRFRPSLEIEQALAFAPDGLPADCRPWLKQRVARWAADNARQGAPLS
jgi:8-oxo-dGTP pyrophosphatase MutT (NUDIX family)